MRKHLDNQNHDEKEDLIHEPAERVPAQLSIPSVGIESWAPGSCLASFKLCIPVQLAVGNWLLSFKDFRLLRKGRQQ